jgi:integrase
MAVEESTIPVPATTEPKPTLPPGLYRRGNSIWMKVYLPDGRIIRESCKTDRVGVARRLLDQRKGARASGMPILPRADRVTLGELFDELVTEYKTNQRRSLERLGNSLAHLRPVFAVRRAQSVTAAEVRTYVDERLEAEAAHATINRELAALKRAYTVGIAGQRIITRPPIAMLAEDNVRQGFFERDEYEAVEALLPGHLHAVVEFMYITGWRSKSEVLPLTWAQIDFTAGTVRLEPGTTKNRKGRTFVMTQALRACLEGARERVRAIERQHGRIIPQVFTHDDGRPIRSFRKSFETACRRAGLPGKIPHDFRRTAVRNLERAGVPRSVAMAMTGHKTESVYRRYDIVSERDLFDAAARIDAAQGHSHGHNRPVGTLSLKGGAL